MKQEELRLMQVLPTTDPASMSEHAGVAGLRRSERKDTHGPAGELSREA